MNLNWRFLSSVSFVEGLSLLLLLFVAMPLKYGFGLPLAVKLVGSIHGILFLALVALIAFVSNRDSWPKTLTVFALLSSSLPFGMVLLDRKLCEHYSAQKTVKR